jgi:hypothetical protein
MNTHQSNWFFPGELSQFVTNVCIGPGFESTPPKSLPPGPSTTANPASNECDYKTWPNQNLLTGLLVHPATLAEMTRYVKQKRSVKKKKIYIAIAIIGRALAMPYQQGNKQPVV